MNLRIALSSLLLATFAPSLAFARPASVPGKVGRVTFILAITHEAPGLAHGTSYEKVLLNTPTLGKSLYAEVIKVEKYSNKEVISNLLLDFSLPGTASGWRVDYVADYGFFLVGKTAGIHFIGGDGTSGFPINMTATAGAVYHDEGTYTEARVAGVRTLGTSSGRLKGMEVTHAQFRPVPFVTMHITGILTFSQAYTHVTNYQTTEETNTYNGGPIALTNIVGDDGDSLIITGDIHISALKNVADISDYVTAYDLALTPP